MQIGRKIYYDKLSGNVILYTGEIEGDVKETTLEEDLNGLNPENVGVLKLDYGQYKDKLPFYNFHIENDTVVWDDRSDYFYKCWTEPPGHTDTQIDNAVSQGLITADEATTIKAMQKA